MFTLSYTRGCNENAILQHTQGPPVKPAHVQTGTFAGDHLDEPEEAWEKVLWSDETKIELTGRNSTRRIWRRKKDEHSPKNTIPTVTLGGGNIMHRCFSATGQDACTVLRRERMRPCIVRCWVTASFPQEGQ